MGKENRTYIAIDLKSFYASVECVERGRDPLDTNLVVADLSRTEKTICLAVSPGLKNFGIPGRPRLFQVVQKVKQLNASRRKRAGRKGLTGESDSYKSLKDPSLGISYIVAPPRMALYMTYSAKIYDIYLKYIAPEDIHPYSVDEVFMDVTGYLSTYNKTPYEMAEMLIKDVLQQTGITATAGIGTNLYLCKVAMDIVAKKIPASKDGVRIAQLDEQSYREQLWDHKPITDFWRVGPGYAKKLADYGLETMGDVALCSTGMGGSIYNEELLYQLFGINAELLIDHAWGWEPCTMQEIKSYKTQAKSLGSGQVLTCPYSAFKARTVVMEMADQLALELLDKGFVTSQIVLNVGYDVENLSHEQGRKKYNGVVVTDAYGRKIPKHAHGSKNFQEYTCSSKLLTEAAGQLFDQIVDERLTIRRLNITAGKLELEKELPKKENSFEQLSLFVDYEQEEEARKIERDHQNKERKLQEAMLSVKKRYGKNAILKGINFEEGATARERNEQIGGHKA